MTPRRATALLALLVSFVLLSAQPAGAHPLGNFTVNHAVGLGLSARMVRVDYVLDLAELPAFGEQPKVAAGGPEAYAAQRCSELAALVDLTVDGRPLPLTVAGSTVAFPPGQGGLATLRLECALDGPVALGRGEHRLSFVDRSYPDRIGWRELTVAGFGSVPGEGFPTVSPTGRLTNYARDAATEVLRIDHADVAFVVEDTAAVAPPAPADRRIDAQSAVTSTEGDSATAVSRTEASARRDRLAELITEGDRGRWAAVIALVVAAGLGAVHGLAPGHGKTVVAAYLVGTRGTRRQAALLALAVALSHTLGVFILGGVTLAASAAFPLERLYGTLQLASGLLIVAMGLWMAVTIHRQRRHSRQQALRSRLLSVGAAVAHDHEHDHPHGADHPHDHDHDHDHAHDHDHPHEGAHEHGDGHRHHGDGVHRHGLLPHRHRTDWDRLDLAAPMGWRTLAALGLSGGLVPSASAVIVLLGAVQAGRLVFGAGLILAFGTGLSLALVGVGLGAVGLARRTGRALDGRALADRFNRHLAPVAAAAMAGVGLWLSLRAIGRL